jgi:hypothetical protein
MKLRRIAYFPCPNTDDHASELEHLYADSGEHEAIDEFDPGTTAYDRRGTFYISKGYIEATQQQILRELALDRITSRQRATLERSEA